MTSNRQQVPFCRCSLFWKKSLFVTRHTHTDFNLHFQFGSGMRDSRPCPIFVTTVTPERLEREVPRNLSSQNGKFLRISRKTGFYITFGVLIYWLHSEVPVFLSRSVSKEVVSVTVIGRHTLPVHPPVHVITWHPTLIHGLYNSLR